MVGLWHQLLASKTWAVIFNRIRPQSKHYSTSWMELARWNYAQNYRLCEWENWAPLYSVKGPHCRGCAPLGVHVALFVIWLSSPAIGRIIKQIRPNLFSCHTERGEKMPQRVSRDSNHKGYLCTQGIGQQMSYFYCFPQHTPAGCNKKVRRQAPENTVYLKRCTMRW